MASGLGPNFILPWAGDIGTDIGGYRPGPDTQQPYNPAWGATPPIDTSGRTWQLGTGGNFVSRGPQSTQWDPNASWSQISTPAGATGALFGDSYAPGFGQGAYGRFQDAQGSYNRRYATDVTDAQGNVVMMSPERNAGLRSGQQYGGRDPYGNAMTGSNYGTHQDFSNFAANQQGANQFLNNPLIQSLMAQQQEQGSPFARADPQAYMGLAAQNEGRFPSTADVANQYVGGATALGNQGLGQVLDVGNRGIEQTYGAGNKGVWNQAQTLGGMRQAGMNEIGGLTNAYQDQLMQQMAQEGQKDLSLGMQDTTSSMAALGLGRSGQAQSTAGGMWNDIQQRNALQRQQLQSQFAENAMGRQADIMGQLRGAEMQGVSGAIGAQQQGSINAALAAQGGGINAALAAQGGGLNALLAAQGLAGQGNESRLQRGYGAGMSGMDALTGSLEGSRAAQRAALGQGYGTTAGWNQNMQGNYLNSLQGADQSALARMNAESQGQSLGLHDYMGLQNTKDQMYNDRMNAMLGLEDRYTTGQNAVLNQMAQYGMMPQDWRMQMVTGISPTGTSQARTSPWGPAIASAGIQGAGSWLGNMNQTPNPGYYGPGQNGGFLLGG